MEQYFLEDCIQMCNFVPSAESKKRNKANDQEEAAVMASEDQEQDLNKVIDPSYSPHIKNSMAQISEREVCKTCLFKKTVFI